MITYNSKPAKFIKIIRVIVIFLFFQTALFAQEDHEKKASVILYSGLKLPESSDFNDTGFGFWLGLSLDVPLGLNWSLEPDVSYWKTKIKDVSYWKTQIILDKKNIHVLAFSLLVAKTFLLQDFSLKFALGPGLGNESNPFGQNSDGIIFINFEISGIISLTNQISFVPKVRYQIATWPAAHPTRESFKSFLFGIGIQYEFIRN